MTASSLAIKVLTKEDFLLVDKIYSLINNDQMRIAWSLLQHIFPKYWKEEKGILRTLWPDDVYRTLYYLDNPNQYIDDTRKMINFMCAHLEGLLNQLIKHDNKYSLGPKVTYLQRMYKLSEKIASQIFDFNKVCVRAKHPSGDKLLPKRLDERTFPTYDTILYLFNMRRLSMKLFEILHENGTPLQEDWKKFNQDWLTWDRTDIINPVIPQREHDLPK